LAWFNRRRQAAEEDLFPLLRLHRELDVAILQGGKPGVPDAN
jgi:hypothetical protein